MVLKRLRLIVVLVEQRAKVCQRVRVGWRYRHQVGKPLQRLWAQNAGPDRSMRYAVSGTARHTGDQGFAPHRKREPEAGHTARQRKHNYAREPNLLDIVHHLVAVRNLIDDLGLYRVCEVATARKAKQTAADGDEIQLNVRRCLHRDHHHR